MREPIDGQVWEHGWDGHETKQLLRLARLTFAEKLRWLEEADQIARRLLDPTRVAERGRDEARDKI